MLDTGTFDGLVRQYQPELYAYTLRLAGNESDAQDVLQTTLCKAFANIEKFEQGTNFRAWVYTIARNTYINAYRKKQLWREERWDSTLQDIMYGKGHDLLVDDNSPEKILMDQDTDIYLRNLITLYVPAIFSEALLLRLDGLPYKDIATICQVPIGTVMSRLCRGRQQFIEQMRLNGHATLEDCFK